MPVAANTTMFYSEYLANSFLERPVHETIIHKKRIKELEKSHTHSEWQEIQSLIKSQETQLQDREKEFNDGKNKIQDIQLT